MRPINVLSLFDGMSCGRIALERAGIPVANYFASEIDPHAIKVSRANWPDIVHLGDVRGIRPSELPPIDLLIGGSPCQGFSFAGKQLNFDDPRSALFFEFVRIHTECLWINPDLDFMLENVRMKKEYQDIISQHLGVQPVAINSALVSAQNRYRLYWTSLGEIEQPEDKGLVLADILERDLFQAYSFKDFSPKDKKNYVQWDSSGKGYNSQQDRAYHPDGKMCTLPYHSPRSKLNVLVGDEFIVKGGWKKWLDEKGDKRLAKKYSALDPEKAITLTARMYANWNGNFVEIPPTEKTNGILKEFNTNPSGRGMNGNVYAVQGKSPTITTNKGEGPKISFKGRYYRKLTPVECERLQTVPDNYTAHVSNTQRYKMLGNGWTVDVIAHIFENLKTIYDES